MPPIEDTAETEAAPATETEAAPADNNVALAVKIEGTGEHTPPVAADEGMGVGDTPVVLPPAEDEEAATPAANANADDVLREALVSFQAASGALYHFGQVLGQLIVALQPHVPALVEPEHPAPPSDG